MVTTSAPVYVNTIRKASRYAYVNGMTDVFLKEHPVVNPMVMNYKIRYNNRPATRPVRYKLRSQTAFSILFVVAEKRKAQSGHARLHA